MNTFEIWMEGYIATGEHGTAQLIGHGDGETFDDAVKDYMKKNPDHIIEEYSQRNFSTEKDYENRRSNWKIWGCALFDNEYKAREAFG